MSEHDLQRHERAEEYMAVLLQTYSKSELYALAGWGIGIEGGLIDNPLAQQSKIVTIDGVATHAEIPRGQPLVDDLDPFELRPDSPLYQLFEFPPIRRQFAIGQLGLSRDVPFINYRSRGQHEFQVALEGLKAAVKLGLNPRDQLFAFIAGAMHDPHPVLGDTSKELFGIDETDAMIAYWDEKHNPFWNQWLEAVSKIFPLQIAFDELKEFVAWVIRRQDNSLPGVLTHGPSKSELDLDFFSFTAVDAVGMKSQSLNVFDARYDSSAERQAIAESLPQFSDRMTELREGMLTFNNSDEGLGRLKQRQIIYFDEIDIRPHLEIYQGHLLVSDPDTFHRLAQLSAVLYESHYYHPNNLGPEWMFSKKVRRDPSRYPPIQDFLRLTDQGMINRLGDTPAGYWTERQAHHGWKMAEGKNDGRFPRDRAVEGVYPPVNLRLSTLVQDKNGKIGPWKELFPQEAESLLRLEQRSGKPITLVHTGGRRSETDEIAV